MSLIPEPRIPPELEDYPLATDLFYGLVLRNLAGQLGPMNDFYVPLIDAAKKLTYER